MDAAATRRRFDDLVLPHLDAAYNLARWLCGNTGDADDVVQEAFLRAFRLFGSFRGDQPRPWLLAIVRNTWFTTWRKRKTAAETGYDEAAETDTALPDWHGSPTDPEQWLLREEDVRLVHAALEQLPVAFREVLILRELEELHYRDIARIADIPVGTVMSRLARGRRMLAAAVVALRDDAAPRATANAARHDTGADSGTDTGVNTTRPAGETGHGLQ
ncbi:RNA polymerase sigma-70 factor, ECF subfamily [Cupriavidus sp. YR651]|uniref:RNA polymerase sigma factor n=1 Tax=Cupriavidus sp. YR651 TaxID=1855315 RepID=UPI00088C9AB8|nr:RNA polymerase sigma factor [Cupriavidus sp. YR651]SDC50089.1 RNA polymerase sigma-70 factor, ECF subfamily [Cupriavidus sp. YR651]